MQHKTSALNGDFGVMIEGVSRRDLKDASFQREACDLWTRQGGLLAVRGNDLAAIAPFYLQVLLPGLDLRVLRIVRLVRVFKLSHYSSAIEDLIHAIEGEKRSFIAALYLLLIVLLLFGSLMYFAEHSAQPDKFGSIPQSLYWAAITLTTVGYGDVSPMTWVGQVIAVMTAFMGVCTVALLTGIVANAFANQLARRSAIFEAELRQALKDGELHEDEIARLEQMKKAFNLSDN
jgi:voltage-gated potassium channel